MRYTVEFKPQAAKDLAKLSPDVSARIVEKIAALSNDLAGDVKRLTNFHA